MVCLVDYIGLHRTLRPSISGFYVTGLMGVELSVFDSLEKEEQEDFEEAWLDIYNRAQVNMVIDLRKALQEKFIIAGKINTRETSSFTQESNSNVSWAGLKIESSLTKYMEIEIQKISFASDSAVAEESPAAVIRIEDKDGILIDTIPLGAVVEGRNTIDVNRTYQEDELQILIDTDTFSVRKTINKYYDDCTYGKLECTFPCYGEEGSVIQVNGGGLNVKFMITCSIERFLCENLSMFKEVLWYKTGVELMRERITSDRVNRYTTLSTERATALLAEYTADFDKALASVISTLRITEDPVCFSCKSFVSVQNYLP